MGKKQENKPLNTELTTRELAYVLAYTAIGSESCSHQGKSAIKAGYPEKTADKQASRMMKTPHIRSAIREIHQKMMDEAMINPSKVLASLENILALALAKGDLAAANRSTELQGKYLTMFGDRLEVDTDDDLKPVHPDDEKIYKAAAKALTEAQMEREYKLNPALPVKAVASREITGPVNKTQQIPGYDGTR